MYCEIVVLQKLKLGNLLNLENTSFDKKLYQTYLLDYSWLSNMQIVWNKRSQLKIFKRIFKRTGDLCYASFNLKY